MLTIQRDFAAEMKDLIEKYTHEDSYIPSLVAHKIVEHLEEHDPDLLHGWLREHAVQWVRQTINMRDSAQRLHAHRNKKKSAFSEMAEKYSQTGDPTELQQFLDTRYEVDASGTRLRLADMQGKHLEYASSKYQARANANRMSAAFLKALSLRVGSDRVSDHFSEEELSAMWASLH
jgi:hypothetical protein